MSSNKIVIEVEYYDGDGWTAVATCGDSGMIYAYDRGYSQPEQALFEIILELAKIRAHFDSGAMDNLAPCQMDFKDAVKRMGIFG